MKLTRRDDFTSLPFKMENHENVMKNTQQTVQISLLLLRISVFVVLFFWTLDKFVQPEHTAKVFSNFYMLDGLGSGTFALIGAVQMLIILGFVAGLFKTWTYGLVLAMHTVSTLASWKQFLDPFQSLLFFAAWPMLAACIALFLLREEDRIFSIDNLRKGTKSA